MRKYGKEWVLLILQLLMFYVFPFLAGPTDPMGMVVLIIFATFALALFLGIISSWTGKSLWPLCVSVCFMPSIYLHYNETAWIHAIWYLAISSAGLLIGCGIRKLFSKS